MLGGPTGNGGGAVDVRSSCREASQELIGCFGCGGG